MSKNNAMGSLWGECPPRWNRKRLKYCVGLVNENAEGESDLPYVGLEHVESWTGRRLPSDPEDASDGQANRFQPGDILFGKLRPYLAKVLRSRELGVCSGELLVLRPRAVTQEFLFYFMLSRDFIDKVNSSTYGVKMPRANWDFIGSLPVLLPPLSEQRAISARLDRETARIDALIEKKQREAKLLQEKLTALTIQTVTKGLTSKVKMRNSGHAWIGDMPSHWGMVPLFALLRQRKKINTEGKGHTVLSLSYGRIIPRDLSNNFGLLPESFGTYQVVYPGDIVLRLTDLQNDKESLRVGLVKQAGIITSAYLCLKVVKGLRQSYIHHLLHAYDLAKVFYSLGGGVRQAIQFVDLKRLPILRPPFDEQEAMAAFLDHESSRTATMIEKIEKSIGFLREFRGAFISAAVTGKFKVREEVPA